MSAINKINVDNVSYNIEDSRVDNIADVIPTASTEQKGLVQIGQGINVDANGVISVEASGGDSVSYTDSGNVTNPVTIGQININGTDYNINAPAAYYNNYVSGQTTAVGQINSGSVLGGQEIFVPAVMYEDQIQGSHVLGQLVVGGDSYPITYTPAASGDSVQFNSLLASGTQIGTITINGVETAIYAPSGGSGGGSSVSYQDLTSPSDARVAVGMITIDGAGYNIYVPTTVAVDWNDITGIPIDITKSLSVTPTLASGTKIADVAWYDDEQGSVGADLYAPEQVQANWNETDSSSKAYIANKPTIPTVTVTQTLASGTKIADIDVSGTTTSLYAPAGGSGSTDWSDIQNKPNVVKNIRIQSSYEGMGGTEVATVTWDDDNGDNTATIYAPNGGSGGSVDWSDVQNKPAIEPGNGMNSIRQSGNNATGDFSIAIGYDTQATNHCSLAVGGSTRSKGMWSVATGDGTIAAGDRQIAAGTYNAEDANNYFAFMVGNGDYKSGGSTTIRKNAEATAWNGNKYIEGNLYVGCTEWDTVNSSSSGTGKPELVIENAGGKRVLTEDDISSVTGDTVTVTPTLATGTKIAEIDVSGTTTDIYAPAGGSTDWADITNKPDITPVAGKNGIDNIAALGGTVNQVSGVNTTGSIAIGENTNSYASNAFAFGKTAQVIGMYGIAMGFGAEAGQLSVGLQGSARGKRAVAIGGVSAGSDYQTAIGFNNIRETNGQFAFIVGNGITPNDQMLVPSDAMAIGFDGTQYLAGDLYVNCTDFTTTSNGLTTANAGGTKVATLSDIKADWAITDASVVGYIANKPSIKAGTGTKSIIEGGGNSASGNYSHVEGFNGYSFGFASHAEGQSTNAYGSCSHAEGEATETLQNWAHAEGYHSVARSLYQHTQGKYNVIDANNIFVDIIGNGTSNTVSNAEATDWNGNKYLSGGIYVGCTDYTTTANGLTTLGAGGFRIDQADESVVPDPTEPDETISEDLVMVDTVTKEMGYEEQEDPDNPGGTITVPTTVATTHQRSWVALPKEYTPRDLAVDMGILDEMEPVWSNYGTYTLQIWGVKRYADNGDGTYTEYCAPVYQWVKTADNTPRDETDPTTEEEPTE